MIDSPYEIRHEAPTVDDFRRLRRIAGMSDRSEKASEIALPNSLFAVSVVHSKQTIGMGRIVGDGGCNFFIVDIAVDPEYQGRGLGRRIMDEIMHYLDQNAPNCSVITLLADVPEFYEKYGFVRTAPASVGMAIFK